MHRAAQANDQYLSAHGGEAMRFLAASLLAVGLTVGLAGAADADPENGLSESAALASFDQVWERVRDQYFDFERIADDWDRGREQLRPQAAQAGDTAALRVVLHQLLDLIGESHFGIIAADTFEQLTALEAGGNGAEVELAPEGPRSATGLSVRWVDDALRVSEVSVGSAAARSGIQPGWRVLAVDDFDLAPAVEQIAAIEDDGDRRRAVTRMEYALQYRLSFPRPEQEIEIRFVDLDGEHHRLALSGTPLRHGAVQIGYLPPMTFDFELWREEIPAGCVSVIAFSTWVPALAEEFQSRRDEIFACPAMVLDLRGNPGGVIATMMTLGSDLFEQEALLGTLLRSDARLEFRAMPRRVAMDGTRLRPFSGPIAILIDGISGSTSELFASGMQATERAKVFGQRSAGMALPSRMLPLASGDYLMYAFADWQDSLGRRVEGIGVYPDYAIELSAENLSRQRAPALLAALDWINTELQQ